MCTRRTVALTIGAGRGLAVILSVAIFSVVLIAAAFGITLPAAPYHTFSSFPAAHSGDLVSAIPTSADDFGDYHRYFNDYQLSLTAGQAYEAILFTEDFDSYLALTNGSGTLLP